MRAANIKKCTGVVGKEVSGQVSYKHVYEIAKIKKADECYKNVELEKICKNFLLFLPLSLN